ncbi:MAG: argininosuccinate synthase, argininosuccinate synthase [Candidatus Peregrinibacteria bacterium GW2011_GWC2_39_14]|nr:MAG: argininosuccinate synthase, argininosuccinate synthase [Candidatus Peregrinibacteria bacterium GW2011_GWC2_39_14]
MKNTYNKIASYEAKKGTFDKILLLYSGGLDTSVMVKWLKDNYKTEVYTLTLDIGQVGEDFEAIQKKAIKCGAKKAIVIDAQEEFAEEYLNKAIKSNANYQNGYHLYCPIGRAIIAKKAVEIAHAEGISVIAHGCTGKGNNQVRLDSYITILDPSLKIIAPVREWSMTRKEELKYAEKHGIPIPAKHKDYSYDENLWGLSSEGSEIEDSSKIPNFEKCILRNEFPENAPNDSTTISIEFEKGIPIKLNGVKTSLVHAIKALQKLGSAYGIGLKVFIEDRIVGLKVRSVYEQPAAEILITAHKELEKLVSTKDENEFKNIVDNKWADLCYSAKWHSPLMKDLNSFIDTVNEKVTGKVTCKLYKGSVWTLAVESKHSLLNAHLVSFNSKNMFNQKASAGFIELYGLQDQMAHQVSAK